jgi:hypothetical protein
MSKFPLVETEEALLEGELHEGNIFLHVTIKEGVVFTPSVYKRFLEQWTEVTEELAERGIVEVFSFITTKSNKLNKWQKMFGMKPILKLGSHILYRRII